MFRSSDTEPAPSRAIVVDRESGKRVRRWKIETFGMIGYGSVSAAFGCMANPERVLSLTREWSFGWLNEGDANR